MYFSGLEIGKSMVGTGNIFPLAILLFYILQTGKQFQSGEWNFFQY